VTASRRGRRLLRLAHGGPGGAGAPPRETIAATCGAGASAVTSAATSLLVRPAERKLDVR
jgi:hypothetical protein